MKGGPATDPLTGLKTYDVFVQEFTDVLAAAEKDETCAAMTLFDIDWFRRVNDEHGSEVGDEVLKTVVAHLKEHLAGKGTVYRYGGDAIAVVFKGVAKEEAFLLSEQARASFSGPRKVEAGKGPVEVTLSLSAGLAAYPDDGSDITDIVRKVHAALYRAKVSGPDKVCLAREEKMITKTSHYTQGQLQGLTRLAKRMGLGEAELLREGLDDLLRKYNA